MNIAEARKRAEKNADETGADWAVIEDRVNGGYLVRLYDSASHRDLPSVSAVVSPADRG